MCESPQASAPTNFFPAWEKAVFTSLFDEDADALRKAIEDPQFDKTAVVRNYIYDGKLKLFLGDTMLDVAHRNRSSPELKAILRAAGCKAHNKAAVEEHEMRAKEEEELETRRINDRIESEVQRRLIETHGEEVYVAQHITIPELERNLESARAETSALKEKYEAEFALLMEKYEAKYEAANETSRANIETQNTIVKTLGSEVDALTESLKQKERDVARKDTQLITLTLSVVVAVIAMAIVVLSSSSGLDLPFITQQKLASDEQSKDPYQTLKI